MTDPRRCDAIQATTLVPPTDVAAPPRPRPIELVPDELILQSFRPSAWMIPITSGSFVLATGLLMAALAVTMHGAWTLWGAILFQVLGLLAAGRIGWATLQWATQLYVLTNLRVMCMQGTTTVDVRQLRLVRVGETHCVATWSVPRKRLADIVIHEIGAEAPAMVWEYVPDAGDRYRALLEAVRKAQAGEHVKG